jgi:AcrR family transcriptional regulator
MIIAGDDSPKARILAAAGEQLSKFGLRKFTVIDVAEAAGMTHPNIYRYFTSKTALIDALITNWLKPLEERIEMVVSASDPVGDKLERMVVAVSGAYRTAKGEEPHLFAAFVVATGESRAVSRKHRARIRKAFDRVLDEGIGSGAIGITDRPKAQLLLLDSVWRFIDPASILVEQDVAKSLDGRLERVIEAALFMLIRRRTIPDNM